MSELCLGCMKKNQGEDICPFCNFPKDAVQASPFLPLGTVLKNRYIVGKVIDYRADSTRYIGYDKEAETAVTIREFMPKGMFTRLEDSTVITVKQDKSAQFNRFKEKFVALAKQVERYKDCNSIVPVCDIFDDNNTSYVIGAMDEVIPFAEYIKRSGGSLEWDVARPLFMPLLSALSDMSKDGLHHFAICPANLVVTPSGKARITSFAIKEIRQTGNELQPQLFSGCSALEQYEKNAVMDEATDVYGFTATLFFALTGNLPADAVKRKDDSKLLMSTSVVKRLPPHVISALADGLQVEKENRTANFKTLKAKLSADSTVEAIREEISKPSADTANTEEKEDKRKITNFQCGIIAMLIALVVFGALGFLWYSQNPLDGIFNGSNEATEDPSAATDVLSDDFTYPPDSEYFRTPNLIGKTLEEAQAEAANSGEYNVFAAVDKEFSDTIPEGQICKQTPDAKMTVTRGNDGVSITVTISKGPQYIAVPKVENLTKDSVAADLEAKGFIVNSTLDYSDTVPEGNVISYVGNVKEGDKLEYGSTITICVSLGQKPQSATEVVFTYSDSSAN